MASPRTALILGAFVVVFFAFCVLLTLLTRNVRVSDDGLAFVTLLAFAVVGVVVARRQRRNPIGWILLSVALVAMFQEAAKLYLVLDYRIHHGALPLGRVVVYWAGSYTLLPILIGMPAILLFPDGGVPSTRWRRALWAYVGLAVLFMVVQFASAAQLVDGPVKLQVNGEPSSASKSGVIGFAEFAVWLSAPLFVVLAGSFVGHQVAGWRRSTAERREQLKWLMSGGAISVVSCVAIVFFGTGGSVLDRIAADLAVMGIAALPVGIGIGILKYRLYEIDRLVSRTISYALLTAMLVGIFVGIVVVMTDLLPLSSPVAVAASTLAAAALFNPLRLKSQRLIDRRFNRARYDAQATVAAFNARLRDALDLDSVRGELIDAVDQAIAPAHASLWIRPSSSASPHSR